MARKEPQINFRIPEELKARLEAAMAESGKSLTSEIVLRLHHSFDVDERYADICSDYRLLVKQLGAAQTVVENLSSMTRSMGELMVGAMANPNNPASVGEVGEKLKALAVQMSDISRRIKGQISNARTLPETINDLAVDAAKGEKLRKKK